MAPASTRVILYQNTAGRATAVSFYQPFTAPPQYSQQPLASGVVVAPQ